MRCASCGSSLERKWRYCPACGQEQQAGTLESIFNLGDIFKRFGKMDNEFEELEKTHGIGQRDMEIFNLIPQNRKSRMEGFSINIVQQGDEQPKVSVRTFGNVKKEDVEKSLRVTASGKGMDFEPVEEEKTQPRTRPSPKTTEEPKTQIKRAGDRITVEMELPGASEKKIEIKKLTESVEVKAVSGGKAFFKILTLPKGFELGKKEFSNGKLRMEFLL
ncbi:MAG: zinc ribbon domain-containing protein [Candidatus Aenigmatarchaeota archaeon]